MNKCIKVILEYAFLYNYITYSSMIHTFFTQYMTKYLMYFYNITQSGISFQIILSMITWQNLKFLNPKRREKILCFFIRSKIL